MNMLTVNPMPHSAATPASAPHVVFSGILTSLSLMLIQLALNTPVNLPISRPVNTPNPTPSKRFVMLMPSKHTPALANANRGMMK